MLPIKIWFKKEVEVFKKLQKCSMEESNFVDNVNVPLSTKGNIHAMVQTMFSINDTDLIAKVNVIDYKSYYNRPADPKLTDYIRMILSEDLTDDDVTTTLYSTYEEVYSNYLNYANYIQLVAKDYAKEFLKDGQDHDILSFLIMLQNNFFDTDIYVEVDVNNINDSGIIDHEALLNYIYQVKTLAGEEIYQETMIRNYLSDEDLAIKYGLESIIKKEEEEIPSSSFFDGVMDRRILEDDNNDQEDVLGNDLGNILQDYYNDNKEDIDNFKANMSEEESGFNFEFTEEEYDIIADKIFEKLTVKLDNYFKNKKEERD